MIHLPSPADRDFILNSDDAAKSAGIPHAFCRFICRCQSGKQAGARTNRYRFVLAPASYFNARPGLHRDRRCRRCHVRCRRARRYRGCLPPSECLPLPEAPLDVPPPLRPEPPVWMGRRSSVERPTPGVGAGRGARSAGVVVGRVVRVSSVRFGAVPGVVAAPCISCRVPGVLRSGVPGALRPVVPGVPVLGSVGRGFRARAAVALPQISVESPVWPVIAPGFVRAAGFVPPFTAGVARPPVPGRPAPFARVVPGAAPRFIAGRALTNVWPERAGVARTVAGSGAR